MKKVLVAAILGIALNVTMSYGQGYIVMENYTLAGAGGTTPVYAGVTYGASAGANAGKFVGNASGFKADLLYSLDGGTTYTTLAGSATPFYVNGGVPSQDGGSPTTDGAGSFLGATLTIPGYTSGAVVFEVRAFNGADYASSVTGGKYFGTSNPFTISSLNNNQALPSGDLLNASGTVPFTGTTSSGLQPFVVNVPEPTVFGLAGLGAAGLMAFRRRKKA
jgi:hypothetical protein